jgi:DNA-binding FadR family transcriptional regulator
MIRRTGLIDGAVDTLRERITAGEWPVGTRIPPEPALAALLGVGRNTVREAVQSLVHAGLLARPHARCCGPPRSRPQHRA